MTAAIVSPQIIEQETALIVAQAKALRVTDQASLDAANDFLRRDKACQKEVLGVFGKNKRMAYEAYKAADQTLKRMLEPLEEGERIVKKEIGSYLDEQARIRMEAERKAREEARKAEEDRRLREAVEAEAEGDTEAAEAILNDPTPITVAVVAPAAPAPKAEGLSTRQVYSFEIVEEGLLPREYLIPDTVKIGAVVRALKDRANIPGVQVTVKTVVASRA